MKLAVVGISHKELAIDARGCFHFTDSQKLEFAGLLLEKGIEQCVILSTCNRSEVYFMYQNNEVQSVKDLYIDYLADSPAIFTYQGKEAIFHMLSVACGLESMLVREDQILGQVKQAYDFTRNMQIGGKEINLIFAEVIHFVKQIKTEFSQPSLSLSHVAIDHLKKNMTLNQKKIMIVGAGEVALSCLPYLYPQNEIYLANRTSSRVKDIKQKYPDIQYITFDERLKYLNEIDVLISATSSPHYIFYAKDFINTHLIAIDLAIPRDIEKNKYVECIDFESLQQEIDVNNQLRQQDEICIHQRIKEEVEVIETKLSSIQNDYMIQSLQAKSLEMAERTYQILINKLDLSQREQYILQKTLKASFLQMIREPIHYIKTKEIENVDIIHQLFDIKEEQK